MQSSQLHWRAALRGGGRDGWAPAAGGHGGTDPQRLLAGWPGNRLLGRSEAGLYEALSLEGSDRDGVKTGVCRLRGNLGNRRKRFWFCFVTVVPNSQSVAKWKVLGAWASAKVVCRCLFFNTYLKEGNKQDKRK